jgi:hypothetical protein
MQRIAWSSCGILISMFDLGCIGFVLFLVLRVYICISLEQSLCYDNLLTGGFLIILFNFVFAYSCIFIFVL